MPDDLDRELSLRSYEDRVADVCPVCGLHMELDQDKRLAWLKNGGKVTCVHCGVTKTRQPEGEHVGGEIQPG